MKNGPYELVIAPKNYPGMKYRGRYAYEHIVVWWKKTGSVPPSGYEIHHINMEHRDNRIKNLKLVTSNEHKRLHGALLREKSAVHTECFLCKKKFKLTGSDYRRRTGVNKMNRIFCSSQCGAINQYMPD